MDALPLLPTMAVGSYASPGWMFAFRERMSRGEAGPDDIEEAFRDATRIAIGDQLDAGVDIVCDGEMRRMRFVYEAFSRIEGVERVAPTRRLGVPGYDRAPHWRATDRIRAPRGLGIVSEYRDFIEMCPDRPKKIAFPGPLTFGARIDSGVYGEGPDAAREVLADLAAIASAELEALFEAGASLVQLDEPGLPRPPDGISFEEGAEWINRVVGDFGDRSAVHVCFGNNASRPAVRRDLSRLYPSIATLRCKTLMLEFANREMADLEGLPELAKRFRIAAGVIDVKSFHEESADEVSERIFRILEFVPAEQLWITMDCGLSAIPRWLARHKLGAMVDGTRKVRDTLA